MFKNRSIRSTILWVLGSIAVITASTCSTIVYSLRKADLIHEADARLLMAVHVARDVAGPDYHGRITDSNSRAKAEFDRITAIYDDLCLNQGHQNIWSAMLLDG